MPKIDLSDVTTVDSKTRKMIYQQRYWKDYKRKSKTTSSKKVYATFENDKQKVISLVQNLHFMKLPICFTVHFHKVPVGKSEIFEVSISLLNILVCSHKVLDCNLITYLRQFADENNGEYFSVLGLDEKDEKWIERQDRFELACN